jgi:hypothetical protein
MKSICSADHIIGYNESTIAKGERNDCVVRAIASTFSLKYDVAHKFVADEFERQPRKGTFATSTRLKSRTNIMGINYNVVPKENLLYPGSARHQSLGGKSTEVTLSIFLEKFPKGKYLVIVKGHAFSIIDGIVIGNNNDGSRLRAKILFALKVEE